MNKKGEPVCVDPVGTCPGDVCRLDLNFTRNLVRLEPNWNEEYHPVTGFNRKKQCSTITKKSSEDGKSPSNADNGEKGLKIEFCCGEELSRHPFRPDRLECCEDGTTKPFGTC